ncbi:DNA-binding transcriptional LysR family regulator [Sinorhizobium kostiense]|uniref:DNA-binding transcriptional LysR family regulator n=1 Tax=Sinorhizobium kostiense TaxID=76747 RepID=A0ABS4QT77_9HYPH|nr:LysR substrate-binding domain-containing protein [Sinorhizobium kostiense]MBP2233856.1 DNA-binding transcriptional LysR family regulator [Sinorhizobium kostiense]
MLNLNDLQLFVRAVDSGGFTAAARMIGAPKSTISKRVAELEVELGARLIHRTSRNFTLTEVGREFYEHARASLIEAEAAEEVVRRRLAEPVGRVRITSSVPVAQFQLADRLAALSREYPRIHLDIHVTDRFVDLIHEGFDIAIRSHMAPLPDSGLMQRRMSVEPVIVVASRDYVAEHGKPQSPLQLADHAGVNAGPSSNVWRLRSETGEEVRVSPRACLSADEAGVLLRAARAGLGVVRLPETIARPDLDRGELVHLLPGWTEGTITTTILMPHRRGQLPAVRAVVDFLTKPDLSIGRLAPLK